MSLGAACLCRHRHGRCTSNPNRSIWPGELVTFMVMPPCSSSRVHSHGTETPVPNAKREEPISVADGWDLLTPAGGYLLAHFALYIVVLRYIRPFSREYVIFLYHAISFLFVIVVSITICAMRDSSGAIHGAIA